MTTTTALQRYLSEVGLTCRGGKPCFLTGWCLVEQPDDALAGTLAVMTQHYEDHQWELCHRQCLELIQRGAVPLVRGPGPGDAMSLEGQPSLKTITTLCQSFFHSRETAVLTLLGRQSSLQEVIDLLGRSLHNVAWIEMPQRHTMLSSQSSRFIEQIKTLPLHELLGIYPHRTVKINEKDAGYLLVYPPEGISSETLMNQGALTLTIMLERRTGRSDDAIRRKEGLLQRLLFCDDDEAPEIENQAKREWPEGEKAIVIIEHRRSGIDGNRVKKSLDGLCLGAVQLRTAERTIMLCRREQWEHLGAHLSDDALRSGWRVAAGGFDSDAARLRESYSEAKTTLRYTHKTAQTSWLCWEQCDAQALLSPLADSDEAWRFITRRLGSVARDEELIHTLEALELSGWHQARAARRLSIHYNTLRQRLARIAALAPGLLDTEQRSALSLALLLLSLRRR